MSDEVRAIDESREPLCARCQASFRVGNRLFCEACVYDLRAALRTILFRRDRKGAA